MDRQQSTEGKKSALRDKIAAIRREYREQLPDRIQLLERHWGECRQSPGRNQGVEKVVHVAKSLKGSAATFGLVQVSQTAGEIDRVLRDVLDRGETISAPVIETVDGAIEQLRAQLDEGATASEPAPDHAPPGPPRWTLSDEPAVVLSVVDDPSLASELGEHLEQFGFRVTRAASGTDLAPIVHEQQPAAIVADIGFPDRLDSGIGAFVELRQSGEQCPPVIFLCDHDDLRARLRAAQAGGAAYMVKPVDMAAVIDKLRAMTSEKVAEPYRVLLVGQSETLTSFFAYTLEEAGMAPRVTNDPMSVLEELAQFNPELILLDTDTDGVRGEELAAVIRQEDAYLSIPIVFLSSETHRGKQLYAMSQGADDLLVKPVQADELVTSVWIRAERYRQLRNLMTHDSLTGLRDHTHTKHQLKIEIKRARRRNDHLVFAVIDIDNFRAVNESHGHPAGDRLLKSLAGLVQQRLRATDTVGRYGGDQLALIMDGTTPELARPVLEDLRERFSQIRHQAGDERISATFSCGVAGFPECQNSVALSGLAEQALQEAKLGGRNCVVVKSGYQW